MLELRTYISLLSAISKNSSRNMKFGGFNQREPILLFFLGNSILKLCDEIKFKLTANFFSLFFFNTLSKVFNLVLFLNDRIRLFEFLDILIVFDFDAIKHLIL